MRSLLTRLTERIDKNFANRNENTIDEGMSMNDFKKFMNTCKRKGVNFNRMSATQLMYTLYRNLDKKDFTAIAQQLENIDKQQVITSCGSMGSSTDCGSSPRRSSSGCGTSPGCGSERPSRRHYSCGGNNDRC